MGSGSVLFSHPLCGYPYRVFSHLRLVSHRLTLIIDEGLRNSMFVPQIQFALDEISILFHIISGMR